VIALDASALLSVVFNESDAADYRIRIASQPCVMPMSTALEAHIAARTRFGQTGVDHLTKLLTEPTINIAPLEPRHLDAARDAFDRYGKGRHKAALNFGDCLVYGFAKAEGLRLLFKGNDFAQTDIVSA
jgi:ribonuclease VapC